MKERLEITDKDNTYYLSFEEWYKLKEWYKESEVRLIKLWNSNEQSK